MALTEVRQAGRVLRKSPGLSALAVVTLALGIGATATMFSVVRGILLEPLPYHQPDRIVQLWQIGNEGQQMSWSSPNLVDVREASRSFDAVAAYQAATFTVTGAGEAARVPGAAVTPGFFDVFAATPTLGRTLLPDDHETGASVAVVSHAYWRGALGGTPDVVGRTLYLNGGAVTVVGVLPERLGFPASASVWVPTGFRSEASRTAHNWRAVGRLAPDASVDRTNSELATIAERLKEVHGDNTWMHGARVIGLHDELVSGVRPALLVLLGAAALLLLIAAIIFVAATYIKERKNDNNGGEDDDFVTYY